MLPLVVAPRLSLIFNYLRFYHILLSYASFFDPSMVNKSLILNTSILVQHPVANSGKIVGPLGHVSIE